MRHVHHPSLWLWCRLQRNAPCPEAALAPGAGVSRTRCQLHITSTDILKSTYHIMPGILTFVISLILLFFPLIFYLYSHFCWSKCQIVSHQRIDTVVKSDEPARSCWGYGWPHITLSSSNRCLLSLGSTSIQVLSTFYHRLSPCTGGWRAPPSPGVCRSPWSGHSPSCSGQLRWRFSTK